MIVYIDGKIYDTSEQPIAVIFHASELEDTKANEQGLIVLDDYPEDLPLARREEWAEEAANALTAKYEGYAEEEEDKPEEKAEEVDKESPELYAAYSPREKLPAIGKVVFIWTQESTRALPARYIGGHIWRVVDSTDPIDTLTTDEVIAWQHAQEV